MADSASVLMRARARNLLLLLLALTAVLALPATAGATISSVFGGAVSCEVKTSGAEAGQRWCGETEGTTVPSWDGTPLDVSVAFPSATNPDGNYPVVALFPSFGATKILPSSAGPGSAQRWLKLGYAVFSVTPRGWGASCKTDKSIPACEKGFIHLMSRRYEVRDAQYLLGVLADEGVIDSQQIGVSGASYGAGTSIQLGALKDRVELANGELIPWVSPDGKPMQVAASAPERPWSDLLESLMPNGSKLDYVAEAPYAGALGNHEFGIQKQSWDDNLYAEAAAAGSLAPAPAEPEANLTEWTSFNNSGGPYYEPNGEPKPLTAQQETQLVNHSAYYASLSEQPAPALLQNGWNDDLFPVDESVDYYNKVRASYPSAAIELYDLDYGHQPRSATTPSASEVAAFETVETEWFNYFVRGEGSEPANAHGGVTAVTSACSGEATATGQAHKAANWARLAPGEINVAGAAEQTIAAPGVAPKTPFTSGTVCTTEAPGENASAATYKTAPAPAAGFTIAGSSTVIGEFSTPVKNDQIIARLYDVAEAGAGKQRLIGRATYRPLSPGGGYVKQVFQLHPQAWTVESGHIVKLELLIQDPTYARTSSSTTTSAASIAVRNLELRIPTIEAPGSDGGLIQAPLPSYLPPGYTLARNEIPSAPTAPQLTAGETPNADGMFTLTWAATQAATSPTYTLEAKNASSGWSVVASGLASPSYTFAAGNAESEGTWTYRVTESNESPESPPSAPSGEVKVDETQPNPPLASADREPDYAGGGGWYRDGVTVSFAAAGDPALADGSAGSGVNLETLSSPETFTTSGSHTACGTIMDAVGNVSRPGCITVQVDATPPSLEISCPSTVAIGQKNVTATVTASDGYSGLREDPSGSVPIDTDRSGPQTITRTAVSNVGLETTRSCTTDVGYYVIVEGPVHKLTVRAGEAVELTSTARVEGRAIVKPGGALDVEGATLAHNLAANGASLLRVCGARIDGNVTVHESDGPVVVGEGGEECEPDTVSGHASFSDNLAGVTIEQSAFGSLKATGNDGGTIVTHDKVAGSLTVLENAAPVIDRPNEVRGRSKLQ